MKGSAGRLGQWLVGSRSSTCTEKATRRHMNVVPSRGDFISQLPVDSLSKGTSSSLHKWDSTTPDTSARVPAQYRSTTFACVLSYLQSCRNRPGDDPRG